MALTFQWALNETAKGVYNIARGVLLAATVENVQVLPQEACAMFGATLAMSRQTCDSVEKALFPKRDTWPIQYLKALVGYSQDDCASQLRKSDAGVRFLALACALDSMRPFEAAGAVLPMLEATCGGDTRMIPSRDHLSVYFEALKARCSFSGFGKVLVAHRSQLAHALEVHGYLDFEYETTGLPSSLAIKELVLAFRDIGRIGDDAICGLQIRASKCAPWIAALTEWCLEPPSIYLQPDKIHTVPVLESQQSRITIVIPVNASEWDDSVHITRSREIDRPETLLFPTTNSGSEWTCMVDVKTYGKWLLREFGFDYPAEKSRLYHFLPDAIIKVIAGLQFYPSELVDQALSFPELENTFSTPLPPLEEIKETYGLMFEDSNPRQFRAIEGAKTMIVTELPEVETYLKEVERTCPCNQCLYSHSPAMYNPPKCKKDVFIQGTAKIIAGILTLSLFKNLEPLRVETTRLRYLQNKEPFVSDIISILKNGNDTECDAKHLLASARMLLGHERTVNDLGDRDNKWDWVITCAKGQAVYPAAFDEIELRGVQRQGYLRLECPRGVLQREDDKWMGNAWKGVVSAETTWAKSNGTQEVLPGQVLAPENHFQHLSAHWEVTKKDIFIMEARIILKEGQKRLQTTRSPIDSLMGLQWGMMVEWCLHNESHKSLAEPAKLCIYVNPDFAHSYRRPGSTVIVPVDGAYGLRFFCLPGAAEERRPFVLRTEACLECALEVCRKTIADYLIL